MRGPVTAVPVPSTKRVLLCAIAILVVDAIVLNQGAIAMCLALWMLFGALPLAARAKYSVLSGEFRYLAGDGKPMLLYPVLPRCGTRMYYFESVTWKSRR